MREKAVVEGRFKVSITTVKSHDFSIFHMASKDNKAATLPAGTSLLMLLSVSVAIIMAISVPYSASAQGSAVGSVAQQDGQPVLGAQEAGTSVGGLGNTTAGQPGGGGESSPCTPPQTAGGSVNNATANAPPASEGARTTAINNDTTMLGGEGDARSTSQIRDHIEQACIALEVGDTEGALIQLNFAIGEIGGGGGEEAQGNNTFTSSTEGAERTSNEAVSVGGTGPSDDYDPTADD
jgi:hypothetical protein